MKCADARPSTTRLTILRTAILTLPDISQDLMPRDTHGVFTKTTKSWDVET